MKQASVLLATARAHKVLPVPGGPYSRTPFGGSIPRLTKRSGWRRGVSTTSLSFSICSLQPPTSLYVTSGFSSTYQQNTVVRVNFCMNSSRLLNMICDSDLHHCDCRVDLWREGNVYLVPGKVVNWSSMLSHTRGLNMRKGTFKFKITYLFLSTPTLMPSSMSVGATLSARSTTNLANCFTLMMYLTIV